MRASNGTPPDATAALSITVNPASVPPYPVLEHFGTWTGSGTAAAKVDADHAKFVRLLYGGAVVDAANYTVSPGSTVLTFTEAYLKSLPNGTYRYTAEFSDGVSEDIVLVVDVSAPAPTSSPDTPKTGDGSVAPLVLVAAALGVLCALALRRRRHS